ncbi:major facilitator superfamily domain-containing protein [Hyaloraphidium curvatum]|nr:major facilitator superfamily domain-containing protein [Hyaloraphidium curvatum]
MPCFSAPRAEGRQGQDAAGIPTGKIRVDIHHFRKLGTCVPSSTGWKGADRAVHEAAKKGQRFTHRTAVGKALAEKVTPFADGETVGPLIMGKTREPGALEEVPAYREAEIDGVLTVFIDEEDGPKPQPRKDSAVDLGSEEGQGVIDLTGDDVEWDYRGADRTFSGDAGLQGAPRAAAPPRAAARPAGHFARLAGPIPPPLIRTNVPPRISPVGRGELAGFRAFRASPFRLDMPKPVERANPVPIPSAPAPPAPTPEIVEADRLPDSVPAAAAKDPDKIDPRVWPIAVSSALMGLAIGVVIPLLPLFSKELGLTTSQFGMLISSMGLARLVLNIPAATLVDRIGRKPLLVGGPLITSLSMVGTGLAHGLNELILWRMMTGAGGSLQMSGAQSYLSDISTTANRARTIAPTSIAFQIGFSIGPSVSGLLAEAYGLRPPFFFVGAAIALVALNNHLMLPETLPRRREAPPSADIVHADGRVTPAPPSHAAKPSVFSTWLSLLREPDVRRVSLLHCIFWITQSGSLITLFPLLASTQFGLGVSAIGTIFTVHALIGALGAQPASWFSDKFGRKSALVPAMALISAGVMLTPFATTATQLYMCAGLWSLGSSLVGSSTTAYVADLVPRQDMRGQALGLLRSFGDLGLMLGAATLGWIAEGWGIGTAFTVNGVVLLAMVARFGWAARETAGRWAKKAP